MQDGKVAPVVNPLLSHFFNCLLQIHSLAKLSPSQSPCSIDLFHGPGHQGHCLANFLNSAHALWVIGIY
jgi:hypothetical protein